MKTIAQYVEAEDRKNMKAAKEAVRNLRKYAPGLRVETPVHVTPSGTEVYFVRINGTDYSGYMPASGLRLVTQGLERVARESYLQGLHEANDAHARREEGRG